MGTVVANPSKNTACRQCRGQGLVVNQASGIASICPLCDGTGKEYDPGQDFRYELGPVVLPANGQIKGFQVNVLDADFRARLLSGVQTAPYTFLLYAGKNKRPFSNQQIHSQNWVGTSQNPFPLLTPYVFSRLAPILVDITDLGGASATPWNAAANYVPGEIVTNAGVYYIALVASLNEAPPNAAFWAVYQNTIRLALHGEEINA